MGLISCSRCGRIHEWGKCPIKAPAYREQRTEIRKFRSSAQWQRKRVQILERDHYLCRMCLAQGIVKQGNEVHHIVKIRANENLKLDDQNLVTLCHACHEFVERNHQFAITLKKIVEHPPVLPEKSAP